MRKINLLKLTTAVLCLTFMLYCLMNYISPENASAEENSNEMRATWVATVFGLDYPSGYTANEEELKEKIDEIMDTCKEAGFNTIFFQVRPACDAFYKSEIFPWSKYLTGTQGKAPENNFDPLEYAISSAHKRNMELHAWINPYRATVTAGDEENFSENNPASNGSLSIKHSDGKIYLNPGLPEVQQLIVDGAVEIAENYEVDGIHLDDYFYPSGDFTDNEAFEKYGEGKTLEDWRRDNVTGLIRKLDREIHSINENIMFSVSPAGIWANKASNPNGSATNGYETYYKAYADTRLWVKDEIIDCIIPQIYWHKGYDLADYTTLVNWWSNTVKGTDVKLCIGIAAYKANDTTDLESPWYGQKGIDELKGQIDYCRMKDTDGYALYRYGSVASNKGIFEMTTDMNKKDEPSEIFTDINKFSWAKEAIVTLYNKKIVNGFDDGSFGGEKQVTRADYTLMLLRATNKTADVKENFNDVSKNDYFYNEIGMAKALGYIDGLGENNFAPRKNISRQDMAVMAYRILQKEGAIEKATWDESLFKDSNEVSDYAKEAVSALCKEGILNGYEDKTFKPKGNATRAETAVVICKIEKLLNN